MTTLTQLFSPGRIGKIEIKNRIMMAPMGTFSYDAEGVPSEHTLDYLAERARGGVGLIISHGVRVAPETQSVGAPNLFDDKYIPIMSRISKAIHDAGAKCALQLNHAGRAVAGNTVIGPSRTPYVRKGVTLKEASKEDIRRLVELYSDAARRVMQAGFDMVEIHAAHGYLLSSFISPFTNRRTDEYGGSPENRARFLCEVVESIRDKVGPDFPISVRFSGADFLSGGTTIKDSMIQAPLFETAGANLLHVSAGARETDEVQFLTYLWPDAYITDLAARIKKVVKIPVCTVGKIGDPVLANRLLEQGKADFIALGRALLADPHWPRKAMEGRLDEINRCLYCNNCADQDEARENKRIFCTVNPTLFREKEYQIKKVSEPKKVMVIGGGLAGLQAARVAAERGHSVTLFEAANELGGAWNIASAMPHKEIYRNLTRQLTSGLKAANVKVVLSKKVDVELVKAEKPDAVVVATGATPIVPDVVGANGSNVVQAVDVVLGKVKTGSKVVIIGGRLIGMETALYLAEKRKKVWIITLNRLGENGKKLDRRIYRTLRDLLTKHGVQIFTGTSAVEIRPDGVFSHDGGDILWLPADTVVLACGYQADTELLEKVRGLIPQIYSIGDCNKPRDGLAATREGMEIGLKVV